ncbi:sister chromatid cohesion protein DCC1 [Macadamia integrifolia]|uniref:sister chromatid cohesion protein DCC1 n=1 Tax=Macadamia integrifolia TaxID=60698 RepID=UPI001C4E74B8|nr:sister chromatid cohesion protein DCC1 [Macadamia integrifolia]XP_042491676.1 sister chromatid cohesion protein DCC1 [Macadamia integrifolia]
MDEQPSCRGGAELVLNLEPNSSISINYDSKFGPQDDLILLEVDEKLLPDILQQRATFRGKPDEEAVLCTPSKTYAVKFVGNSNTVFLIPPTNSSILNANSDNEKEAVVGSVLKVAPGNMELVEVAPKLDELRSLLRENPYRPEDKLEMDELEMEELDKGNLGLFPWEDLVDRIQASDEELRAGLRAVSAVCIDGSWGIVDEEYMNNLLTVLLHLSVSEGWSLSALKEDEVVGMMEAHGYPSKLVLHCLEMYGSIVGEDVNEGHLWMLDEKRVCVNFARGILRGGKRKMESFMEEWMLKIPQGMRATFDMLEGEVLVERLGVETWLHAFSVSLLPSTPTERFSMLFRQRQKWEWKDLEPYIKDLRVPGLSSEGLLLKYTRRTQPTKDSEPVFTAR